MSKKEKILIIDDDNHILTLLGKILNHGGYDVLKANNGEDGVQIAMLEPPDLIICDYMMPSFSGEHVLRQLKSTARTAMIPVIILTAAPDKEVDFLQAGAVDYLVKPVKAEELLARVERTLNELESTQLRLLKEFTGTIAHEINQPLSVIVGRIELLKKAAEGNPELEEHIRECNAALQRLTEVIEKFHDLKEYRTRSYVDDIRILNIHTDNQ